MAALLSDVIEDGVSPARICKARGIAPQVCDALELLSRDKDTEGYEDFILRIIEAAAPPPSWSRRAIWKTTSIPPEARCRGSRWVGIGGHFARLAP